MNGLQVGAPHTVLKIDFWYDFAMTTPHKISGKSTKLSDRSCDKPLVNSEIMTIPFVKLLLRVMAKFKNVPRNRNWSALKVWIH